MAELEYRLQTAFEETRRGVLFVIATGNELRQWQWYVHDRERTMELVNKTLGELEPFPVQFSFQQDSEWFVYGQFLALTGSIEGSV